MHVTVESQTSGSLHIAYQTDKPLFCALCRCLILEGGWYTKHTAQVPGREEVRYFACMGCYPVCLPRRPKQRYTGPVAAVGQVTEPIDIAEMNTMVMGAVRVSTPPPPTPKRRTVWERVKTRLETF